MIAAGHHLDDGVEARPRQLLKRVGPAHARIQVVGPPVFDRDHGHDLLRQDIERVCRHAHLGDLAAQHRPRHPGHAHEVDSRLRDHPAGAPRTERVPGAPDALESARDRGRRLDLTDEIDRPHVDSQLERRGRDERRQTPGLQVGLDLVAILLGDAPVVSADDATTRQPIHLRRDSFHRTPVVGEDQCRGVLPRKLEQPRVDRRPDRRRMPVDGRRQAHVRHRRQHPEIELLPHPAVDDRDRAGLACRVAPAEEPRHAIEWTLRRRQPDANRRAFCQRVEALQKQGEKASSLFAAQRVDLVDDDVSHAAQHFA